MLLKLEDEYVTDIFRPTKERKCLAFYVQSGLEYKTGLTFSYRLHISSANCRTIF